MSSMRPDIGESRDAPKTSSVNAQTPEGVSASLSLLTIALSCSPQYAAGKRSARECGSKRLSPTIS